MDETAAKLVLIVEDDPALAALYKEKFEKEKYKTLVARDGAEGLNFAITRNPDCILLDMLLPKLNGLEMMEKLLESPMGNKIPVVFLTNVAEKEEKEKAFKMGAKEYLTKAMQSPEQIVQVVKKYL